jgi:signal transduction histidine kinase
VRETSELYASRAEQAGLAFDLVLPETEVMVWGDEAQLRRALGNLLDNGIKFTPEGGSVCVGVRCVEEWAELWVEDTGIGVPEQDLPHLFGRFHRGRNVAVYPGNGLGLAIVKAIVEGHGGRVTGENLGPRTRFTLRLPHRP